MKTLIIFLLITGTAMAQEKAVMTKVEGIRISKPENVKYYVIQDKSGTITHYGIVEPGQELISGLGQIETTEDEKEWRKRLSEVKVDLNERDEEWVTDVKERNEKETR